MYLLIAFYLLCENLQKAGGRDEAFLLGIIESANKRHGIVGVEP